MDFDAIIRTVVQEVLEQMRTKPTKPCVMILAERNETLTADVRAMLREDVDCIFTGETTDARTPCRTVLPFLSCNAMAELARGGANDPIAAQVLPLLLSGIVIEVLQYEYRKYSDTAPGPLYSLYQTYKKTLEGFGIREFQPAPPNSVRLWEELITEQFVRRTAARGASTLVVPAAAKVTPLAVEAALEHGITIQKSL